MVAENGAKPKRAMLVIPEEEERATVEIFGEEYELASADDYSVPQIREFNRMWKEISDLETSMEAGRITAQKGNQYERNLEELVKFAVPSLPEEVLGKLKRSRRSAIVMTFFLEDAKRNPMMSRQINALSLAQLLESNNFMADDQTTG